MLVVRANLLRDNFADVDRTRAGLTIILAPYSTVAHKTVPYGATLIYDLARLLSSFSSACMHVPCPAQHGIPRGATRPMGHGSWHPNGNIGHGDTARRLACLLLVSSRTRFLPPGLFTATSTPLAGPLRPPTLAPYTPSPAAVRQPWPH